jgi:hypothetical protein
LNEVYSSIIGLLLEKKAQSAGTKFFEVYFVNTHIQTSNKLMNTPSIEIWPQHTSFNSDNKTSQTKMDIYCTDLTKLFNIVPA